MDIQQIKQALNELPEKLEKAQQDANAKQVLYLNAKVRLQTSEAKAYLEHKASFSEHKEAQIKAYVKSINEPERLEVVKAEADYEAAKGLVEGLAKQISAIRSLCELERATIYASRSIEKVENIKDPKKNW